MLKAGDAVYHLDNQAEVEKFAGLRVKVSGTLDSGAKLIHVSTAEAEK